MDSITILSTLPFLLHVLTAVGVVSDLPSTDVQDDVISYWTDAAIKCYSLTPTPCSVSHHLAYFQACLAVIAFLVHTSNKLQVRKIGYGILLLMYIVTQIRHVIWDDGVQVIAFLFTHIAVFCTLVLYNDTVKFKCDKSS